MGELKYFEHKDSAFESQTEPTGRKAEVVNIEGPLRQRLTQQLEEVKDAVRNYAAIISALESDLADPEQQSEIRIINRKLNSILEEQRKLIEKRNELQRSLNELSGKPRQFGKTT